MKLAAAGTARNLGKESKVIEDITGTTVYVIAIIAVIPVVGLLAWFVRLAVRRKGLGGSESSSETGLNRPITEEDALQITGRAPFALPTHSFDTIQEAPENIPKVEAADMLGSVWEFPRARLRLQTVLGEGNFGKVWKAEVDDICGYEGTILVAVKGVKENAALILLLPHGGFASEQVDLCARWQQTLVLLPLQRLPKQSQETTRRHNGDLSSQRLSDPSSPPLLSAAVRVCFSWIKITPCKQVLQMQIALRLASFHDYHRVGLPE